MSCQQINQFRGLKMALWEFCGLGQSYALALSRRNRWESCLDIKWVALRTCPGLVDTLKRRDNALGGVR